MKIEIELGSIVSNTIKIRIITFCKKKNPKRILNITENIFQQKNS